MTTVTVDELLARMKDAPARRGPTCSVCALPADVLAGLRRGRLEMRFECSVLAREFLAPLGHEIGGQTVARHFREHERK